MKITILNELGNFITSDMEESKEVKESLVVNIGDLAYLMLPLGGGKKIVMSGDMIKKSIFIFEEME